MKKSSITREQRYQIQVLLQAGTKPSSIALLIEKDKSVISREIKRNKSPSGKYHAHYAQQLADLRKERFKRARKLTKEMQASIIKELEEEQWSPKQIKGRAVKKGLAMVSHERIYQLIRLDKEKGGELYKHTRHRLKHRKRPVGGKKVIIKHKVSIDVRPSVVAEKARLGDWEMDTIIGKNNQGAILTIVERQTGFLLMKKLPNGKHAKELAKAVIDLLLPYKNSVHTITVDNGTEFAAHQLIAKKLDTSIFFAHPYSSWERGLNEYTNKLIRQYIPKKESFENYNDQIIKEIQYKINRRPREILGFENPKHVFYSNLDKKVALAG
jgi:IS30 family transposase